MNTIKNAARRPLRVPLPRGKVLHLPFGKTGQVADDALEHPPLKKMIEAGDLEVLGHGVVTDTGPASGGGGPVDTHGHGSGGNVQRRSGTRGT